MLLEIYKTENIKQKYRTKSPEPIEISVKTQVFDFYIFDLLQIVAWFAEFSYTFPYINKAVIRELLLIITN